MGQVLRAGVIGAGVFGGYHAGKYAALPGVTLAGVHDHHRVHAEALVAKHGGQVFETEAELIAAVDVVSIATPAICHAASAIAALEAGKPVYIEKPVATSLQDAARIVQLAKAKSLVAACGFLERASLSAMGLFDIPERPKLLEAVRIGLPSPRNLDVSVVLDLMVHDLDLALALTSRPTAPPSPTAPSTGSTPKPSSRAASSPASAPLASPRPASAPCASSIRRGR